MSLTGEYMSSHSTVSFKYWSLRVFMWFLMCIYIYIYVALTWFLRWVEKMLVFKDQLENQRYTIWHIIFFRKHLFYVSTPSVSGWVDILPLSAWLPKQNSDNPPFALIWTWTGLCQEGLHATLFQDIASGVFLSVSVYCLQITSIFHCVSWLYDKLHLTPCLHTALTV